MHLRRPSVFMLLAVLGLPLLGGGCGGGSAPRRSAVGTASKAATLGSADPASVAVIRMWSTELARGDLRQAANLFALPSRLQVSLNTRVVTVHRRSQVLAFEALLPCGAHLLRADRRGRFVNALFLLGDRPDSACDATGASARVAFVIRSGLIAEWHRAPSEAGDPGIAPGTPRTPGAPDTTPGAPPPRPPAPGSPAPGPLI